jgi:hypothetical protein
MRQTEDPLFFSSSAKQNELYNLIIDPNYMDVLAPEAKT